MLRYLTTWWQDTRNCLASHASHKILKEGYRSSSLTPGQSILSLSQSAWGPIMLHRGNQRRCKRSWLRSQATSNIARCVHTGISLVGHNLSPQNHHNPRYSTKEVSSAMTAPTSVDDMMRRFQRLKKVEQAKYRCNAYGDDSLVCPSTCLPDLKAALLL